MIGASLFLSGSPSSWHPILENAPYTPFAMQDGNDLDCFRSPIEDHVLTYAEEKDIEVGQVGPPVQICRRSLSASGATT